MKIKAQLYRAGEKFTLVLNMDSTNFMNKKTKGFLNEKMNASMS